MAKTLFVRSATKDRKVALSEAHEDHPGNHEAWVVGYPDLEDGSEDPANIVEVGDTPLVRMKLANGELLEAERPMARQQAARAESAAADKATAEKK